MDSETVKAELQSLSKEYFGHPLRADSFKRSLKNFANENGIDIFTFLSKVIERFGLVNENTELWNWDWDVKTVDDAIDHMIKNTQTQ